MMISFIPAEDLDERALTQHAKLRLT